MSSDRISSSRSGNNQPYTTPAQRMIGQGNSGPFEEHERARLQGKARMPILEFLQKSFHWLWLRIQLQREEKQPPLPTSDESASLCHPGQESMPIDTMNADAQVIRGQMGSNAARQPLTLADLPEDILLLISEFCKLQCVRLGNVSCTCRRLRDTYSPIMFQHITVRVTRDPPRDRAEPRPPHLFAYARTLKIFQALYPHDGAVFRAVVYPLLDRLPWLSTVDFEGNTMFDLDLDFLTRLSALTNLRALHIMKTQLSPASGDLGSLHGFSELRRLAYTDVGGHLYREPYLHPDDQSLSREAHVLMKLLLCASETIEELDIPPESVDWSLVEHASFPNLRRLKLFGWPMKTSYPFIRFLSTALRLRFLSVVEVPLESVGQEAIWPSALSQHADFFQTRTPLANLSVLRISNPVLMDRIYDYLPEGLHTLRLVPYRSGVLWALRQLPCPMLNVPSLQSLLERSPVPTLRILAIAFIGHLPSGFIGRICVLFPNLVQLELHRWDEAAEDTEKSAGAMSDLADDLRPLTALCELRLNLNLPDAAYWETRDDDDDLTPAQLKRDAEKNAYYERLLGRAHDLALSIPSLHCVFFFLLSDSTACIWRGHKVQRSSTGISIVMEAESGDAF